MRGLAGTITAPVRPNVTVIGLAAVYLARVRLRNVQSHTDLSEARVLAVAGVEQAVSLMNNLSSLRRSNPREATKRPFPWRR